MLIRYGYEMTLSPLHAAPAAGFSLLNHRMGRFRGLPRKRPLIPYCRSALNSLSPNALACPAVEPNTRAGLFLRVGLKEQPRGEGQGGRCEASRTCLSAVL
jgi:hypothetical protein